MKHSDMFRRLFQMQKTLNDRTERVITDKVFQAHWQKNKVHIKNQDSAYHVKNEFDSAHI